MTLMEDKLRAAGVRVPPILERIWLWLKDHPQHTAADISKAIKLGKNQVASAMYDLDRRNMVEHSMDALIIRGMRRTVKVYSINPRMHGAYELWPAKNKMVGVIEKQQEESAKRAVQAVMDAAVERSHAPLVADLVRKEAPVPSSHEWHEVSSMPLAKARILYDELHKFFGPK